MSTTRDGVSPKTGAISSPPLAAAQDRIDAGWYNVGPPVLHGDGTGSTLNRLSGPDGFGAKGELHVRTTYTAAGRTS